MPFDEPNAGAAKAARLIGGQIDIDITLGAVKQLRVVGHGCALRLSSARSKARMVASKDMHLGSAFLPTKRHHDAKQP
ncbi:hypothetical protein [Mesorhizobium sp. M0036]|uniref:hypothetical protein n=1 Tax=Mesorhizobium sp. M0036 TaxID=2956853 RepID=UPI00333B25AA